MNAGEVVDRDNQDFGMCCRHRFSKVGSTELIVLFEVGISGMQIFAKIIGALELKFCFKK